LVYGFVVLLPYSRFGFRSEKIGVGNILHFN
jgi:hypothetical protein